MTTPNPSAQPGPSPLPSGQSTNTTGSLTRVRNAAIELVAALDDHINKVAEIESKVSALTSDPKGTVS
jgi:hypothetical protein